MKVLAKNLEILLLNHDLVVVPGLGGFLVDYQQARIDEEDDSAMLPPSRTIVFNKELKNNDGLLVNAYMHNFDANYPQAYRQLEIDVEEIYDFLNGNGWVILENIGTLRMNIEGAVSFEQFHQSVITPSLFALPALKVKTVAELEKERNVIRAIEQNAQLPVAEKNNKNNKLLLKRRWKDIAISSAAAVALFFLFAFPAFKGTSDRQYIAGPSIASEQVNSSTVENNKNIQGQSTDNTKESEQKTIVPSTQIILLQAPQQGQGSVVISPQQFNQSNSVSDPNGDYTIVVTVAANEQCAQSLVNKLNRQNIPRAYYYSDGKIEYVLYSRFATYDDANNTLESLKQVNKRFKKAWIMNLNKSK